MVVVLAGHMLAHQGVARSLVVQGRDQLVLLAGSCNVFVCPEGFQVVVGLGVDLQIRYRYELSR